MIVEIDRLCVDLGGRPVLRDITAHVAARDLVVLIGANASGKSTLLRTLVGHVVPVSGAVRRGELVGRANADAVTPDRLPRMLSGRQALDLTSQALQGATQDAALAYAGVVGLLPMLDKSIGSYSLGTRQKLCIALSLVGSASLYLWDEIANGLDLLSESRTLDFLRAHLDATGAAAVLATHNLDVAQHFADQVWLLDDGYLLETWRQEDLHDMRSQKIPLSSAVLAKIAVRELPTPKSMRRPSCTLA